jgi:hypothetical protein
MNRLIVLARRLVVYALLVSPVAGQYIHYPTAGIPRTRDGKPDLGAACPRTADGHPDLSGLWIIQSSRAGNPNFPGCEPVPDEFANIAASLKPGLPYQKWAADLVQRRRTEQRVNDPVSNCLPVGPVRVYTWNSPHKLVQAPGLLVILSELNASYRQIFTDGRPLPEDPNPSWNGYSSGKWDGDTLVIETRGFRDGLWLDATGNPLTDAGKLTERLRRPDFGHLQIELTVDDPKAYTKPWSVKLNEVFKADTEMLDFICNENEKDVPHLSSK